MLSLLLKIIGAYTLYNWFIHGADVEALRSILPLEVMSVNGSIATILAALGLHGFGSLASDNKNSSLSSLFTQIAAAGAIGTGIGFLDLGTFERLLQSV